ncbi:MAG TPA: hypothetical protein VK993_16320 [Chthoniobacterales bacterium]|nr:hypothetical protein [Chthoniobacterales bacterium]
MLSCGMRYFVSTALGAAVAVLLLPLTGEAQEPSPEALAQEQLAAVNRGDWTAYAARMHPKSLARLQTMMMPIVELAASKDPRAGEQMRGILFGGRSAADLKAMTPNEFFEIFMSSISKFPGMADALQNARRSARASEGR